MFTLDLKKLHQALESRNAKQVLFLLPEGVVEVYRDIDAYFRNTPIQVFNSGDEHWGGCDIPLEAFEDLKVDTIVSVGHTEYFRKDSDRILFFPMDFKQCMHPDVMDSVFAPLYDNYKTLAIAWSTEFKPYSQPIYDYLKSKMNVLLPSSSYLVGEGQVLGCSYNKLANLEAQTDSFLVVSDAFHSTGSLYDTRKPVFWLNPYDGNLRDLTPLREPLIHNRIKVVRKAEQSKHFGIVVEKRYGQQRVATAKKLKKYLEASGRNASIFYMTDVTPAKLTRYLGFVEVFVNTACPRIESFEESGIFMLNIEEALAVCGMKSIEDIYPILAPEVPGGKLREARPQEGNTECGSNVSSCSTCSN